MTSPVGAYPVDYYTPMRLADAVEKAFPYGGMTVSGLLTEAAKGRLVIMRIASKRFVTLAAIEDMKRLCQEQAKAPDSTSAKNAETRPEPSRTTPHGSSETAKATLSRDALLMKLKKLSDASKTTSPQSTNRSAKNRTLKAS